jgi:hypothetical protein
MPARRAQWFTLSIVCCAPIVGLVTASCSSDDSTADTSGDMSGGRTAGSNAGGGGAGNAPTGSGGNAGTDVSASGGHSTGGDATGGNVTGGNPGSGGASGGGGAKTDAGTGGVKGDSGSNNPPVDGGQLVPLGVSGSWKLSFSDEFNGTAINTANWRIMDTGDQVGWGTQKWRAADSFLDGNGLLVTRLTTASGALTAGAIYSKWKLSKGYYEARIKHEGGWFAWWIESPEMGNGGANEDPAVYGTEMDICEADAWTANVLDKQHAIHWHGYAQYHQTVSTSTGIHDNQWHVYGFKWSDAAYDFYVDGAPTWHFTTAISQTLDEDMIINNASYMGSQTSGIAYVDYVRYWTAQ